MTNQSYLVLDLIRQFQRVAEAQRRTVEELGVLLVRAEALVQDSERPPASGGAHA